MIYLQNNSNLQRIKLPIVFSEAVSDFGQSKFLLFSDVNRCKALEYMLPNADFNNDYNADFAIIVQPIVSASGQFYILDILTGGTPQVGEYSYALVSENKGVLSKGIAIVGEYHSEPTDYEITKEYTQYEG